jgi:hypothetical protein
LGRVPYPAPPPMNSSSILALFGAALLATPVAAQSNVIPGTDVSLGILSDLTMVGRQGNYPAGMNALAMATTSCNKGSVDVPWLAPMQENHPMMAFMVVRYDPGGRIMQVSDYSAVKHGFFALANSQCDSCTVNPFGHNGLFLQRHLLGQQQLQQLLPGPGGGDRPVARRVGGDLLLLRRRYEPDAPDRV